MAVNIKLTKQQQQILAAAVVGLGAFGYIYIAFFWLPISNKITQTSDQITQIEAKIDKAKREAARKDKLEAELRALSDKAAESEKRLPKEKSTPDILVTISQLADKYHVDLVSFAPGATTNKQFFSELNYPISVKGHFHDVGKFLAAISLEERIFNVQNVSYGSASADGVMTVNFTLISYQYKG